MFHPPSPLICSKSHYFKFPTKNSVNVTKTDDLVLSFQQDEVKECDTINAMTNSLVD